MRTSPIVRPRRAAVASAPVAGSDPPDTTTSAADDRFFRRVVSSMRNGVVAIHRDGRLALMNDEAYRIFSLTRKPDDVGRPFVEVFGHRPDLLQLLAGAFELATLPNRAELRLTDVDRLIGHTMSQVKDEDDSVIGAVVFFKDLTRVEEVEERERLRDRLAALGEMAAGIAHELKNPLAAIAVSAGLLRRAVPDSEDAQALLADVLSEAKLANTIVSDMLEFVRPLRLRLEKTQLADVLQEAIASVQADGSHQCGVRLTLPADLPIVEAEHQPLCQVFASLLVNAFEALGGCGEVEVTATVVLVEHEPGGAAQATPPTLAVIVDVTDGGPGVPAPLVDRIFDPFFTTKPEGIGLGLSMARKILDAHNGQLTLTKTAEGRTRFRVTLPVAGAASGSLQKGS